MFVLILLTGVGIISLFYFKHDSSATNHNESNRLHFFDLCDIYNICNYTANLNWLTVLKVLGMSIAIATPADWRAAPPTQHG
ncbi:hypothetical protein Y032_0102g3497 [Ancylostoma ceylanicum]|uniref:Uncharacterized protein n=1 Tax=Ancylostoma ceylanicum TaxID=53326 RepID=A0A016THG3_9BILA|nr:hypothetical protein Y032_0102g3497 [Ancylostoma ceylanicum]